MGKEPDSTSTITQVLWPHGEDLRDSSLYERRLVLAGIMQRIESRVRAELTRNPALRLRIVTAF